MKGQQKAFLSWLCMAGLLLSGCGQVRSPDGNSLDKCKKIAFVISKESVSDIYVSCPDGSQLTNLTNDPAPDSHPAWSPDGTKIAFASARQGNSQIYVMNADGSGPIRLTADQENDFPVWLPDGRQIAFRSTDGKGLWWWRIVDMESRAISELSEPSYDFFFQTPAWSPDGHYIAYMSLMEQQSRNDGSSQIHIKTVDGSKDTALTRDIWANINPVWSPDGTRIAFLSERDGTYNMFALYVMNSDGTRLQKLTQPLYPENVTFTWSPAGSEGPQIAISSDVMVGSISILDVDTGKTRELLDLPQGERASAPSWQP